MVSENDRIKFIGNTAMNNPGKKIVFVTDADPPSKIQRYAAKLQEWFPLCEVTILGPISAGAVAGRIVYEIGKRDG